MNLWFLDDSFVRVLMKDKMQNFIIIFSILIVYCHKVVHGGAIPINDGNRRISVQESPRRSVGHVPSRGDISLRRFDLKSRDTSHHRERFSSLHERDELMERLLVELRAWHSKKHGYKGPNGKEVGGKALLGTLSSIVGLVNTLLPWFGINPPMSDGMTMSGEMMSGQMMSGQMMSGQMMSGQMMSGGGHSNFMLVPIHSYYG